ncbi:uncharacterized protein LOC106644485 [Copidosoma floridanum]|uniref:uncharacterized protein LOC106644485 n=1 Tax=Copidosoma floridanum TaxID=29053 RepID=UPI0006C97431|nr:uncharacterized protein LOC106644485 [Copidosoma floridanum]
MKVFLLGFLLIFLPAVFGMFAGTLDGILHRNEDECIERSRASYSEIEQVRLTQEIPENDQMKEFAKCMMEKFNVMDNSGSVNQNIQSYGIPSDVPNVFVDVANKCKTERGSNSGETARKIMSCFIKNNQIVMGIARNPKA